jgi:hypothetical protein
MMSDHSKGKLKDAEYYINREASNCPPCMAIGRCKKPHNECCPNQFGSSGGTLLKEFHDDLLEFIRSINGVLSATDKGSAPNFPAFATASKGASATVVFNGSNTACAGAADGTLSAAFRIKPAADDVEPVAKLAEPTSSSGTYKEFADGIAHVPSTDLVLAGAGAGIASTFNATTGGHEELAENNICNFNSTDSVNSIDNYIVDADDSELIGMNQVLEAHLQPSPPLRSWASATTAVHTMMGGVVGMISSAFSLGSTTSVSVPPHDSDDHMWPAKLPGLVGQAEMQLQTSLQQQAPLQLPITNHNSESLMGPSLGPLATTDDAAIGAGELTLMGTFSTAPASTIQRTSTVASAGEQRRIATKSSIMPASGRARQPGPPGLFTSETVTDINDLKWTSAISHFGGDVYWFNNTNLHTTYDKPDLKCKPLANVDPQLAKFSKAVGNWNAGHIGDEEFKALEAELEDYVDTTVNQVVAKPATTAPTRVQLYRDDQLTANERDAAWEPKRLLQKLYADLSKFETSSVETIPGPQKILIGASKRPACPVAESYINGGRKLGCFDHTKGSFQKKLSYTGSRIYCWDKNCNGATKPTAHFSTKRVPRIIKRTAGDCAFVSRIVVCDKCHKECPALNQNTLQHLPAPLVREEFDSLLDPDSFTDDGNTVLSAELVDIAISFSSRGDPLASVSEYFNSALTKAKAETMQSWWYDNAVYRACLIDLVGDEAWSKLTFEEKLPLLSDRSEFCKVRAQQVEDITDRVFADAILGDTAAINLALALGVDSSRVLYRRFMDGICDSGLITGISLDWTHLTAKHLGEGQCEKWLLTVVDQQQRLIGAWFTADTALATAKPLLLQLKTNGCKPLVVALDNLPPTINRDTGMVTFLKEDIFPESCKVVIQDLFHVVQNFAADFGSKEDAVHYHQDVTMGVRKAMRYMHHNKKSQVVDLLKDGKLSVSIFYHGTWYIADYRKMKLCGEQAAHRGACSAGYRVAT